MANLIFGKPKTQQEVLRENKRGLTRNQRDLDREIQRLDREEKKLQLEIKSLVKKGQNGAAKTLAKEIVRIRQQKEKIYKMRGQLGAVSTRTTTMAAQQKVAKSMGTATRAMQAANRAAPIEQTQRVMQEFEKQNEIADMKEEMMDDMFDDPELDEEADTEVAAVLDSIGLDLTQKLGGAKVGGQLPAAQQKQDQDIEAMLKNLNVANNPV